MAKKKSKSGLIKSLLVLGLVFGPALLLIFISLNKCDHKFEELPIYGNIGDFNFVTAEGKLLNQSTQKGKITLYTTLQTTCPKNCAIDLAKFNLLLYQHYRKYQKNMSHIKFVSIVTDENGNPVDDLEEITFLLEDLVEGYDPEIWSIVTGDPSQIYDIESNNVNLYTHKDDTSFAGKPYLETMLIVDKHNNLRLIRRGNEEGLIRDFKEHVALLQKQYDKAAYKAKKE